MRAVCSALSCLHPAHPTSGHICSRFLVYEHIDGGSPAELTNWAAAALVGRTHHQLQHTLPAVYLTQNLFSYTTTMQLARGRVCPGCCWCIFIQIQHHTDKLLAPRADTEGLCTSLHVQQTSVTRPLRIHLHSSLSCSAPMAPRCRALH